VAGRLRKLIPMTTSALALWAWSNREEVAEWGAFSVRAVQNLVSGSSDDTTAELRLRGRLYDDRRTRRAHGLSVRVRNRVAIFTGLVHPDTHGVAVHLAEQTEGIDKVDDRLVVLDSKR
jgi:osmotically-inducible protein OsmY